MSGRSEQSKNDQKPWSTRVVRSVKIHSVIVIDLDLTIASSSPLVYRAYNLNYSGIVILCPGLRPPHFKKEDIIKVLHIKIQKK